MPLTEDGKKMLRQFRKEYGDKEGQAVFYAKENDDPKFRKLVTGKAAPGSPEWWQLRAMFLKAAKKTDPAAGPMPVVATSQNKRGKTRPSGS